MALNNKQKAFVNEYLIDLNASQAAIRAGYSPNGINKRVTRMMANEGIQKAIQEGIRKRSERTCITQDMVLDELRKLSFFDARKLFSNNGMPLQIKELDDDTAACITGIKVKELFDQDNNFVGFEKEYKLADKKGSLELLGRHLGIFNDKLQINNKQEEEKNKKLDAITGLLEQMHPDKGGDG